MNDQTVPIYCPTHGDSGDPLRANLEAASSHLSQARRIAEADPLCVIARQVECLDTLSGALWLESINGATPASVACGEIVSRWLLVEHLQTKFDAIPPAEVKERVEAAISAVWYELHLQQMSEQAKLADMAEWLDQQEALSDR